MTYFLTVSTLSSPFSRSQRLRLSSDQTLPRPAAFSKRLVRFLDDLEGRRIVEAGAVLPADHHMERIGTGELGIDAARRGKRLLAVRNLIGEPIARLKLQVQRSEVAKSANAINV